jgi:hypothetical protein
MADRLHVSATELSAATYRAREWKEPDDAACDNDPPILFNVRRRVLGREVDK